MRYDLDHPPVIIKSARWKMALLLLVCTGFVFLGIFEIRGSTAILGYVTSGFFGLGILVALWRLVQPAWLELSPGGLRWFNGRKIGHYSWRDFLEFSIYKPSTFSSHPGYVLAPDSSKNTKASRVVRSVFGVDGSLGGGWALSTPKLVDLLNQARAKWAG